MQPKEQIIIQLDQKLDAILEKIQSTVASYETELMQVHSIYKKSAQNLVHYLALRTFKIDQIDEELHHIGLPGLSSIEGHVLDSILGIKDLLGKLLGKNENISSKSFISIKKSRKIQRKNTNLLFGYKAKKRFTRIMVTLPNTASEDLGFVKKLLANGMNCARINCAHDEPSDWLNMINNVKTASLKQHKKCRIAMDLSGPKLRTGPMIEGPRVIHIKPERDDLGKVSNPAKIWIAPPDVPPSPDSDFQAFLPVDEVLFSKIKRGNTLNFIDSRGKKCKIIIASKEGKGKWGVCSDSAFVETGIELVLHKETQTGRTSHRVGELLPKEQFVVLSTDDILRLHRDPSPGEPAVYSKNGELLKPAHISCTLPQIFNDVKIGEPIYFDDGKIEGIIQEVTSDEIKVKITHAKDRGSKLKADKGINLPDSELQVSGLTKKDKEDISFVAQHANAVNFSFVNTKEDVLELLEILENLKAEIGIILKIETQKGFSNLPSIVLTAMRSYPIGVMTARGDLAIETGWKNFASIQQEIMRICTAAHVPNVWATQVLENLAKKGTPSRAEITDAALAQQAECVMLNKGSYIHKAVRMLDRILRRMQRFQRKGQIVLPRLENADRLILSHQPFDIP